MRKQYLDILRLLNVLWLVPFHTMMMYNTWGEGQYVPGVPVPAAGWFIRLTYPWFMPLLFVIAGISARYSLQKRRSAQYAAERLLRIGLPLLTGILLINPFLAYIADVTNNGFSGGYLAHYGIFFTRWTDLTGYDGGFGFSHLWFLIYLVVIALAALPVYLLGKRFPRFMAWSRWPVAMIILLGVVQAQAESLLNIGGKSLAQYFVLFLTGLFALSHEEVQAKLEKFRFAFLLLALIAGAGYVVAILQEWSGLAYDLPYFLYGYVALLALLGFGRRHLHTQNKVLVHASVNSQLYYIIHYPVLTAAAYLLMPRLPSVTLQIIVIMVVSLILTVLLSEAITYVPVIRVLFGVKPQDIKARKQE